MPFKDPEKRREYYRERRSRIKRDTPEDYKALREKEKQKGFRERKESPLQCLLITLRKRARKFSIEFNLSIEDLVVPDVCPVLGIPMSWRYFDSEPSKWEGKHYPNTPSIDRIDSSKGYTKDNIWMISWRANMLKNDSLVWELEKLVSSLESLQVRGLPEVVESSMATIDYKRSFLNRSRTTARKRGLEFGIDISDIIIPEVCPILGMTLRKSPEYRDYDSPSLDRIDSSKGYVKGNVWVVSWRANRIKSNATVEEIKLLIAALRRKMEEMTNKAA